MIRGAFRRPSGPPASVTIPAADSPPARVAFIGGGNMAAALIGGLIKTGWPASQIAVAEPVATRAEWLRGEFGVRVAAGAAEVAADADALLLAVKPQQMREALAGLATKPGALVVSIAAGVRLNTLRRLLGDALAYVRTMPNTPALFGAGITGLYAPDGTPPAARALAERLLAAAGDCVWVAREEELDAVTALSGSGPAYFFLLVEALREAGTALGLNPEVAARLAAQTCVGSARMVAEASDLAETQLREAEAALAARAADLAAAAAEASDAARVGAEDLSRQVARLESAGLGVSDQVAAVEKTLAAQRAALLEVSQALRSEQEDFAAEAETRTAQLTEFVAYTRVGATELSDQAAMGAEILAERYGEKALGDFRALAQEHDP